MNYMFFQYVPYQSELNRNQKIQWKVYENINKPLESGDWEVINDKGQDCTSSFTFSTIGIVTIIQPKDLSETELYSHYFYFSRKLKVSNVPVDTSLLKEQSDGKYLDTTGAVFLSVDEVEYLPTVFKTSVNFLAKINLKYLDQKTNTLIPNLPETITTSLDGYITHPYPTLINPLIPGYGYLATDPELTAKPILQYSEETATLFYGKIEVKSKTGTVPLGMDTDSLSEAQLKSYIESITIDGNKISDYNISTVSQMDTSLVTSDKHKAELIVKIKANFNERLTEIEIKVPMNVTWNNSIAIGGSGQANGASTLALTLHEESSGSPYITGEYGNLSVAEDTPLNGSAQREEPNYQISYLNTSLLEPGLANALEIYGGARPVENVLLNATNSMTPVEMLAQFKQKSGSLDGKLQVRYGDVIGVYTAQKNQQKLYKNNKGPNQPLEGIVPTPKS